MLSRRWWSIERRWERNKLRKSKRYYTKKDKSCKKKERNSRTLLKRIKKRERKKTRKDTYQEKPDTKIILAKEMSSKKRELGSFKSVTRKSNPSSPNNLKILPSSTKKFSNSSLKKRRNRKNSWKISKKILSIKAPHKRTLKMHHKNQLSQNKAIWSTLIKLFGRNQKIFLKLMQKILPTSRTKSILSHLLMDWVKMIMITKSKMGMVQILLRLLRIWLMIFWKENLRKMIEK